MSEPDISDCFDAVALGIGIETDSCSLCMPRDWFQAIESPTGPLDPDVYNAELPLDPKPQALNSGRKVAIQPAIIPRDNSTAVQTKTSLESELGNRTTEVCC